MELKGLDAWITSGRYSSSHMFVTCKSCGETTSVFSETEYGMTSWEPDECENCWQFFFGDEDWEEFYPEEELYA